MPRPIFMDEPPLLPRVRFLHSSAAGTTATTTSSTRFTRARREILSAARRPPENPHNTIWQQRSFSLFLEALNSCGEKAMMRVLVVY